MLENPMIENKHDSCHASSPKRDAGYQGVEKRQFGCVKMRYRSWKKNTAELFTLLALSNLRMVRSKLLDAVA